MSPLNDVRPTMAPDVTVEAVSANADWNNQNARNDTPVAPYAGVAPCRKKYWWPIHPLPSPNMNAKPIAQNNRPHRHVSNTHSMRMLTVSRDRANPASRPMKPACMKNTRNAVTSTHTVLMGLTKSLAWCCVTAVAAPAAELKYQFDACIAPRSNATAAIFPARMIPMSFRDSLFLRLLNRVSM